METWSQRFLLSIVLGTSAWLCSLGAAAEVRERPLIEPDVRPQKVDEALIDTENFEVGAFAGVIHIEDFESSFVFGSRVLV